MKPKNFILKIRNPEIKSNSNENLGANYDFSQKKKEKAKLVGVKRRNGLELLS